MSKSKGVFNKFTVIRNDGKSEKGEKHEHCKYFVLDLTHDKFALEALMTYSEVCKKEYPLLSEDIKRMIGCN